MALEPAPGIKLTVNGGSHYWGDLNINTRSLWQEKATFIEVVLHRCILETIRPLGVSSSERAHRNPEFADRDLVI